MPKVGPFPLPLSLSLTLSLPQLSPLSPLSPLSFPLWQGRWAGSLLCAGRPVCDVMTSARELIRARSYDLRGRRSLSLFSFQAILMAS